MNNSRKSLREHCEWMCNRYKKHPESNIYIEHRAILDLLDKTEWIPVSERLPESDDDVLATDGYDVFVAWYHLMSWNSTDAHYDEHMPVLAWQPLPEPYKEGE